MTTELVGDGASSPTVRSVPLWKRFDALEVALLLGCLCWLLPNTLVCELLVRGFWFVLNNLGISQQMGDKIFYAVGFLLLLCLLIRYAHTRFVLRTFPFIVASLADAMALLSLLYLLDFFLSTAYPFEYGERVWSFFALAPFFVMLLYLNRAQVIRLVRMFAIATGVQALYAIYFYISAQHQFYTPHFGNRTGGTFENPNLLYPLCLLGAPLCIALCEAQPRGWIRLLFILSAIANLIALSFTFMRSGWLGLATAILFLLISQRLSWSKHPKQRKIGIVLLVGALLAVLFVRTRGEVIGNPQDRSTLGRLQIWRVSLHIIVRHPWLGNGLSTYAAIQSEQMTPDLQAFNPINPEAKSLYLNTTAEFGLVGFGVLLLVGYRYLRCYRSLMKAGTTFGEHTALLVGITAGVVAMGVAGLADTPILCSTRSADTFACMLLLGVVAIIAQNVSLTEIAANQQQVRRLRQAGWISSGVIVILATWIGLSTLLLIRQATPVMDHYVEELSHPSSSNPLYPLPDVITDALVSTEDQQFYSHHGVDWEALHHALQKDARISEQIQGGSTITMQAVRYVMLPYDKTPTRKIAQIVLAQRLDRRLSKQNILRLYFDSVTFGLHTAGLQQAAHFYFNKRPEKLTLAECAFLVGIISHPPSSTHEITAEFVQQKISPVLTHMEAMFEGKYGTEAFTQARQSPLHFAWEKHIHQPGKERYKP